MKRFVHWLMLAISSGVFLLVSAVFLWENFMNILALIILVLLATVMVRQAQDLGLLEK